jgi:hypothetical protein
MLVLSILMSQAVEVDTLINRTAYQRYVYPQEKFHVTTDQASFVAGDTIWFRGWVVDASNNTQVSVSRYLYVELHAPDGTVEQRIKIRHNDGVYAGYVPLDAAMAEGDYTLTAYTMFAESQGEDYYFKKKVAVRSPYSLKNSIVASYEEDGDEVSAQFLYMDNHQQEKQVYNSAQCEGLKGVIKELRNGKVGMTVKIHPRKDGRNIKVTFNTYSKWFAIPDFSNTIAVSFHPEGGYIIPGEACKVAFKAIDATGRGVDVSGVVTNSKGEKVADIADSHYGMGYFYLVAQEDETYQAKIGEKVYDLPQPTSQAAVLHVDNSRAKVLMFNAVGDVSDGTMLLVLNRGALVSVEPISKGQMLTVARENMSEGISQFMLIDRDGNCLSERLAFVYPQDNTFKVKALTPTVSYHQKVIVELNGESNSDVAVTVVDNGLAEVDSVSTIQSQLLLQGDLKGHVEDAGYYFRNRNHKTELALDALMLTQGWRRYDIPAVLKGTYSEPTSALEQGSEISGIVKSRWRGKPLSEAIVSVIAMDGTQCGKVFTDADGKFSMNVDDYAENVVFFAQAIGPKGNKEHNFSVKDQAFGATQALLPRVNFNDVADDASDEKRLFYAPGKFNIELRDIDVIAKRAKAEEEQTVFDFVSAYTINTQDFNKKAITTYDEALRSIPGIVRIGNDLKFRGGKIELWVDGTRYSESSDGGTLLVYPEITKQLLSTPGASTGRSRGANQSVGYVPLGAHELASTGTEIQQLEMQYPFHNVERIDFVRPDRSILFSNTSAYAGGVLHFTMKQGDDNGSGEATIFIQVYRPLGYQKAVEFYSPKYQYQGDNASSDKRSTIYWSPSVKLEGGRAAVEFYTSDLVNTTYTVNCEGLTPAGKVISQSATITITE